MKALLTILSLVIHVATQGDFDKMGQILIGKVRAGEKDITVQICPGIYYFRENHIDLSQINEPDVRISISGEGATLIAKGGNAHSFDPDKGYVSPSKGNIDLWSPFYQSPDKVYVLSQKTKQCRIRWAGTGFHPSKEAPPRFIRITHWFLSSVYPVSRLDDTWIYFTANDLSGGHLGGWNVNDDYNYGFRYPRFSVVSGTPQESDLYQCQSTRFLKIWYGTKLQSFSMSGLRFLGNAKDGLTGMLDFMSPQCDCSITECTFEGTRSSRVISVGNANIVHVENCVFRDIYEDGVNASHSSIGTEILNCRFEHCGLGMMNSFCVCGAGSGFHVAHNSFEDFGYSAIGLGYGYLNEHVHEISAVVEDNRLSYSSDWSNHPEQHCLMDSGAIYVSTQNDCTIIRHNTISDYTGMKDNRGIFCDDGAYNLQIYGNSILGGANSYSIDSRRCKGIERDPASRVQRVNYNIRIYDNEIDAPIRFEPREDAWDSCFLRDNRDRRDSSSPSLWKKIRRALRKG